MFSFIAGTLESVYETKLISGFAHQIRSMAAEEMYKQLQIYAEEMPELEELLIGTEW